MQNELYPPGTLVQLKSGGPVMVIEQHSLSVSNVGLAQVAYYNQVTGLIELARVNPSCLKLANMEPQLPESLGKGPTYRSSLV